MKFDLFVADHFDTLASGKTVAVGLYTDRTIVLNVPINVPDVSEAPYAVTVSALACISGLVPGPCNVELWIEDKDGNQLGWFAVSSIPIVAEAGKSTNCVFRFNPFLVSYEGEYQIALRTGESVFKQSLWIKIARIDV